ncbi:hypothetical protein KSP40_PGU006111 [Platanthera guangdongensis]|uniref:Uncharacterized protein n=1 Tax=Platanthera guangdongensis TaxID=2320717 RepID=A0ABR2M6X2_9ASPA
MEGEVEVMEPLEVDYSDLVLLSSSRDASSSLSTEELQKIELISGAVMRVLGPSGPGLLSITGVPKAPALRKILLPFARKLALLGNKERAQVLKENGLGSDVPLKNLDRSVSSFAMQLKYEQFSYLESIPSRFNNGNEDGHDQQLIGNIFKELGLCMIELGLRLAHVCDKMIGGSELGKTILDAGTAKGRLIHYHSSLDRLLLKEENKRTKKSTSKSTPTTSTLSNLLTNLHDFSSSDGKKVSCSSKHFSNLWQQWHYDYGIFTVLTSPLFMLMNDSFCVKECSTPNEHTYLQLFDSNSGRVLW